MRKIALLAGAAGALMIAGPALAQEATPPGRPPVPDQLTPLAQTPPAETPARTPPAQQGSVSLSPGQTVRGPDGELGKLEGVRVNAQGQQELTVRGADGQVRSVPLGGLQVNGSEVTVAWSLEQYQAAPPIAPDATATEGEADGEGTTPPADEATPPYPATPATPAQPGIQGSPATPAIPAMPARPPVENPDAPPVTPPAGEAAATRATPATPAQPNGPRTPGSRAIPATPAAPANPNSATPRPGEDPDT